ncbi:MAG: hypothetical protein KF911_13960 [Pseudomonadales bacterium]|nr:hypothetical protein [Pseudomonadales bacterium]
MAIEVKTWIDPATSEGAAKIVRALLALRNHGGGYLLIGFNNSDFSPSLVDAPEDVAEVYHIDKLQALVGKYASEPFEIEIEFPTRDGRAFPVVAVPSGVRTPVASKADLIVDGRKLIASGDVYVRTLQANNTPSSAKAGWQDWGRLTETCFDNREADIGRFLRRHLAGVDSEKFRAALGSVIGSSPPPPTADDKLQGLLMDGEARYLNAVASRALNLPRHGSWEVAALVDGKVALHRANTEFLNLINSANPRYTGRPVWVDSRGFTDQSARPYVRNGKWEALIVRLAGESGDHIDYWAIDPSSAFYQRRALEDDLTRSQRAPQPLTALDFAIAVLRVAESIAVSLAFARAMEATDASMIRLSFRWSGIRGRQLQSWAIPERHIWSRTAHQDVVVARADVPIDAPLSSLGTYVGAVISPLFEVFEGFVLGQEVVDDLTTRLIERRL